MEFAVTTPKEIGELKSVKQFLANSKK